MPCTVVPTHITSLVHAQAAQVTARSQTESVMFTLLTAVAEQQDAGRAEQRDHCLDPRNTRPTWERRK